MARPRVAIAAPAPTQAQPDRIILSVDATTRKNARHMAVRGRPMPRIVLTPEYRAFVALVAEEARRLGIQPITSGRWRLTVYTTWPRLRHLDEGAGEAGDFPMGDSDAALSGVKDALQEAGILADDVRVVGDVTHNLYEKDVRRIVVVLERTSWDPFDPGEAYVALLEEIATARRSEGYRRRTAEYLVAETVKVAKKAKKPRRKATKRTAKKVAKRAPRKAAA